MVAVERLNQDLQNTYVATSMNCHPYLADNCLIIPPPWVQITTPESLNPDVLGHGDPRGPHNRGVPHLPGDAQPAPPRPLHEGVLLLGWENAAEGQSVPLRLRLLASLDRGLCSVPDAQGVGARESEDLPGTDRGKPPRYRSSPPW